MAALFAEVILPLPLGDTFTYRIPPGLESLVSPGKRVIVRFGKKKSYSALVDSIHNIHPAGIKVKEIDSVVDDRQVVNTINLKFWKWMAHYYLCPLGDVMKAALPAGLRLESTAMISVNPLPRETELTDDETDLINAIGHKTFTIRELQTRMGDSFSFRILRKLIDNQLILTEEKVTARFKPVYKTMVSLHPSVTSSAQMEALMKDLKRAPRQKEILDHFLRMVSPFTTKGEGSVDKKRLWTQGPFSESAFTQLVARKILALTQVETSRIKHQAAEQTSLNLLSKSQLQALTEIREQFIHKPVVLLHGITASGKTEIYIHLIEKALKEGKQILYLVPEISLTPQIIDRLSRVFGSKTMIYHSRMGDAERVEIWNRVAASDSEGEPSGQVILGARSALFLPFSKLGLIIVDEEHENSYKQSDPSPRYHARDMAVVAGNLSKAPVLLGSATPSFESYRNAKLGKYGLVTLSQRFGTAEMPEIIIADIQRARKRREMRAMLTPELYMKISEALENGEQVILFQNRRGYSPFVECHECGWIPVCDRCDVSLTFHKSANRLICHYCGLSISIPPLCNKCGSPGIKTRGFGTEKVEDEIKGIFPGARIARMDLDTTRSAHALEKIIRQLEKGRTDILIGTQMVTKGLDFETISVVGILNADNLIGYPDFRAHERAFQLLMQVGGRSGRKDKRGSMVIQTSRPDHPVIGFVKGDDFQGLYNNLMPERKLFGYPPWFRLIKIAVKHLKQEIADQAAGELARELRKTTLFRVMGPQAPLIGRLKSWHIREIWIKVARDHHAGQVRNIILSATEKTRESPGNGGTLIQIDVDPM